MKKIIVIIFFSLLGLLVFSQANCNFAIEQTKFNYFYIGIPNHIKIVVNNLSADKISVSVSNGEIKKIEGCLYEVVVKEGYETKISVFDKNEKLIGENVYKCIYIPEPKISIAGYNGGNIEYNEFIEAKTIDIESFDRNLTYKIVSFCFSAIIDGFTYEVQNTGNFISSQQKSLVTELLNSEKTTNKKFYVENIKVVYPDGTIKIGQSLSFNVYKKAD